MRFGRTTLALIIAVSTSGCMIAGRPALDRQRADLKLTSWNLEHLAEANGTGCRPRVDLDYASLHGHALALGADVIAFQEVENRAAAERVFDPAHFDLIISGRPAVPEGGECNGQPGLRIRHQDVGFAIRKVVRWTRNPDLVELGLGNSNLRWGVDITIHGARPLRLLAVHLKSGCNSGRSATDPDCPVLFDQSAVLRRWIDARVAAGEDYAILGDWNRRLDAAGDQLFGSLDRQQPAAADLTLAAEGRPATCKVRFREFIDHIVTGRRATARVRPGSFVEYAYSVPEDRHPSDHCPVSVNFAR